MNTRLLAKVSFIAIAAAVAAPQMASAQSAASALRDEILVTATKKADAENVQDVPLAVTAYGDKQLDALKVRDLQSLSYSVPNVSLDDVGTAKGVANFSIRGLGINSSIPSIDPTVGVFVDGMYLGINGGVVFDIFDLESIEVLRGPQGILFGRNTTGGAVLINTKKPPNEFEASFKGAIESGLRGTGFNYYAMGSIGGPLIKDVLRAKVAVYYNDDNGWFKNYLGGPDAVSTLYAGAGNPGGATAAGLQGLGFPIASNGPDAFADFGGGQTWLVRPSLYWTPSESFDLIVRYEHGDAQGDGPPAQNHVNGAGLPNAFVSFPRDSFTMSIDEPGYYYNDWDQVVAEGHLDLGEGGRFTNIFGWRQFNSDTLGDIDGTPFHLFHAVSTTTQDQYSEELRYNKRLFDTADLTVGFYYFTQNIAYNERRSLLGGYRYFSGGGVQDQTTIGGFGELDIDLTDALTFNVGGRYTHEKKDVVISNLLLSSTPCDVGVSGSCSEDFVDGDTWNNFTPKVGFTWAATDEMNVYAHWTKGVRSGGYNFRNTSLASLPALPPALGGLNPNPAYNPLFEPGPFNEEKVNAYEIGLKAQPGGGRATINAAVFVNDVSNMQRELNLADPLAGVVQVIRNTADATIWGLELETQIAFTDNFVFLGNLGHTEGSYDKVLFDLNGDGMVDGADEALEIPRLSPWTWGAGFVHSLPLTGDTSIDTRFNYSHRDKSYYTDNNLGFLNEVDIIDASVAFNFGRAVFSIYGKNLLNQVNFGGATQLPSSLGYGTFSPLMKGRVAGVELKFSL